jgi:hypothetical protein
MSMYKVIQKENRELRSEIRKKDETHVRFWVFNILTRNR